MISLQQRFGLALVADEVVIDDEHHVLPSAQAQLLEFGDQLSGRFGARDAAIHDDDIAELAIERAAPRELYRHGDVVAQVDQVPARHRHARDVGPTRRRVGVTECPAAHVFDDLRHEFFGFAQHEMVDVREGRMAGREERSAGNDRFAEAAATVHDVCDRFLVHDHGAEHHVIGPAQIIVCQTAYVQVHQLELPVGGQRRGHRQQAQRRKGRAFRDETQHMLEAPERVGRRRTKQQDIHDMSSEWSCTGGVDTEMPRAKKTDVVKHPLGSASVVSRNQFPDPRPATNDSRHWSDGSQIHNELTGNEQVIVA